MASITITMRDGTKQEFNHTGRAGGSYTKRVRYEPGFVVIADEWGRETAIPSDQIAKVETETPGSW